MTSDCWAALTGGLIAALLVLSVLVACDQPPIDNPDFKVIVLSPGDGKQTFSCETCEVFHVASGDSVAMTWIDGAESYVLVPDGWSVAIVRVAND